MLAPPRIMESGRPTVVVVEQERKSASCQAEQLREPIAQLNPSVETQLGRKTEEGIVCDVWAGGLNPRKGWRVTRKLSWIYAIQVPSIGK